MNWLKPVLDRPKRVFVVVGLLALAAAALMVRVKIDTDPENMLAADEPVRVFHNRVKARFGLHDTVVIGIERDHPNGVFTPESLGRIYALSKRIEQIDHVITGDLLGPAHVDDIQAVDRGTVRFQWLLSGPPSSQAEADQVRAAAQRLPMLDGTLVSKDGKSLALYVPVTEKRYSYQVSQDIQALIAELGGPEKYHFAGLPVAEDTFGFEMFVQMAICAPLAGLAIFGLMWLFFRSTALVVSPMIVAMATVIITMGALIGSGFTVHIMSSMIAIFLMPIAVVDSVHILSEFADRYPKRQDARATIKEVMSHLFTPMLYTSLTSAAGFLSLLITPIPPVRIFGAFVAFGILLAFALTVVVVPAYVVSMSPKQLASLVKAHHRPNPVDGPIASGVRGLRKVGLGAARPVIFASLILLSLGLYGITRIEINDNPVRWFQSTHAIRIADETLNRALAGTYPAYLVIEPQDDRVGAEEAARRAFVAAARTGRNFEALAAAHTDDLAAALEDKIYTDPEGEAAWSAALTAFEAAEKAQRVFQSPRWLNWLADLQAAAETIDGVGKTTSVADVVKTVHRELRGTAAGFAIPESSAGVAQTLLTFQSSHRPRDLFHVVTPDYGAAAVWFQLNSGDNRDMTRIRDQVDAWIASHPAPVPVNAGWAGLTYINVVWQQKMVKGMLDSLLGAFVVVFLMMVLLFRSFTYGLLSMLPLAFTIILVYGLTGLIGKDYDMPVAVLSSLSLGLSVDFSIHFLERSRQLARQRKCWQQALSLMFEEPGRAIARNAIVIAVGFLPLLAAPLVPYNTVGVLMAAIMIISSVVTLILLPAALFVSTAKSAHP